MIYIIQIYSSPPLATTFAKWSFGMSYIHRRSLNYIGVILYRKHWVSLRVKHTNQNRLENLDFKLHVQWMQPWVMFSSLSGSLGYMTPSPSKLLFRFCCSHGGCSWRRGNLEGRILYTYCGTTTQLHKMNMLQMKVQRESLGYISASKLISQSTKRNSFIPRHS